MNFEPIHYGAGLFSAFLLSYYIYSKRDHKPKLVQPAVEKQTPKGEILKPEDLGEDPVIILGSGLVGSLLAARLSQRGFKNIHLFDRRGDMRKDPTLSVGRSINLALSERGFLALDSAGVLDKARKICLPMKGRQIHSVEGKLTENLYSRDGNLCINSISRGDLNNLLLTEAENNGAKIHFGYKTTRVDVVKGLVFLKNDLNGHSFSFKSSNVLACDGAFSVVRNSMMRTPGHVFDYQQAYLPTRYKELSIPPTEKNKHRLSPNHLHIWPREEFMMIALPNMDGSFTVTCFFPWEGENGFQYLDQASDQEVMAFFKKFFPDALEHMPNLLTEFRTNPTSSLVTVKADPWFHGVSCLFGDAAHAVVPFFGQGMNAGFEDVFVFNQILDQMKISTASDLPKAFREYFSQRKSNCDFISLMALENHQEMRENTNDPQWLYNQDCAHKIAQKIPWFYTRYELVSFSTLPYELVYRVGAAHSQIVNQLIQNIDNPDQIDFSAAEKMQQEIVTSSEGLGIDLRDISFGKYTRLSK